MSLAMTVAEREAFLADVHVGIISVPEADRGTLEVVPYTLLVGCSTTHALHLHPRWLSA